MSDLRSFYTALRNARDIPPLADGQKARVRAFDEYGNLVAAVAERRGADLLLWRRRLWGTTRLLARIVAY